MAAKFVDGYKLKALAQLITSFYSVGTLGLFKLPTSGLNHASVIGDITPADFTGYGGITPFTWSGPMLDPGGLFRAISNSGPYVFSQTGTGTICDVYGWYMTDNVGDLIAFDYNPDGPVTMDLTGLTYVVTLTFGDTNLVEP